MNTKSNKQRGKIPRFKSPDEEAAYWDTHSFADHSADSKPVKIRFRRNIPPKIQFDQWNQWLSAIYVDIQQALINRHIFKETMAVIEANPKIQSDDTFYSWMRMVYSQAAVVAVRRQIDQRDDVASMARLLTEISRSPSVLSREKFVSLYTNMPPEMGHRGFDKFAGAGEPNINASLVEKDLQELRAKAASVKLFSHKRVAHYDQKAFDAVPTWKELDECLDLLETLLKKYLLLFRAESHVQIVPVWQYDWKEIFRAPWIEGGKHPS